MDTQHIHFNQTIDLLYQYTGKRLASTCEVYWQSDDNSGQLLQHIRMQFEHGYLNIHAVEADDSIELTTKETLQLSEQFITIPDSRRWEPYIGKKLIWGRMMINSNGYFDGVQLEFERSLPHIQLICMASELSMYVCQKV